MIVFCIPYLLSESAYLDLLSNLGNHSCPHGRVLLDQPLPAVSASMSGSSAALPVARALKADASHAVVQDLSVGTAVAACMSLLVAAAVAAGGSGHTGR